MGWGTISNEKRTEIYQRHRDGEDIVALSREIDAKVETLSRELRRFRQELRDGPAPKTKPTDTKVDIQDNGNEREIESNSTRITTLDQLIKYCNIDTKAWIIDRHIINKWEVGRKATQKNLEFEGGKLYGEIKDDGSVNVEPLFQIKVWLTKRHPEPIQPVIRPVNINIKYSKPAQRVRGLKSALIIPDPQFGFARNVHTGELTPFHDRMALDLVRQIAKAIEPDMSIFLGDVNDFSAWSDKFIRRPEFYFTTQPSLIESAWYIGQIRELTKGDVFVLEGNHDIRPENQIINHLLEAYQLHSADRLDVGPVLGMDNLLGLSRMGVQYINGYPDGEVWINDTTRAIHGSTVRGQSGQTAAAVVRDATVTTIFGHIHKLEQATRTIRVREDTRYITAYSPGCLCHIDGRVPGSNRANQWQQGAAVVWFDQEHSAIQQINILDGRAVFSGAVYVGHDYVSDLKEGTKWDF